MFTAKSRDMESVRHYKLGYNRGMADAARARTREIVERLRRYEPPVYQGDIGHCDAIADWIESEYLTEGRHDDE